MVGAKSIRKRIGNVATAWLTIAINHGGNECRQYRAMVMKIEERNLDYRVTVPTDIKM